MHKKKKTISTEELKIQQEVTQVRKPMSRQKLKNDASQQKLQGMKLKEQNRKQKKSEEEKKTPEKIKTSTKQVQKHCKTLNIKFDFKKKKFKIK